jgi:hypothetical protein
VNVQGPLTTVVAIACILAVGVASTSLDAVETEPSDVMDTSFIPTEDNQPDGDGDGGGGGSADLTPSEGGETNAGTEETQGTPQESQGGGGGGGSQSLQVTLLQQILNLLREYMYHILGTVGALAAVGLGYVVYKRRFAGGAGPGGADIVYDVDTSNDVYESWWEMVELTEVEDPMTKTPQEFAEEAIGMGYDPDAVSEVTRLFEETLYGGEEVTREEERRAREAIERIKSKGREAV